MKRNWKGASGALDIKGDSFPMEAMKIRMTRIIYEHEFEGKVAPTSGMKRMK